MFVNRQRILIGFVDCDPANVVFFANYFRWFDECTTALFVSAGLPTRDRFRAHCVPGIPLVEVNARFLAPSTHGDEVEVESSVEGLRSSSFVVPPNFFAGTSSCWKGAKSESGRRPIRRIRLVCSLFLYRGK
jgi:4-hydroxybenzoyl-CoA thioesterase